MLLEASPLEDIANARQIAGTMVRRRYFDRVDLDHMLEMVAQDHEAFRTTQSIVKIAFPLAVVLSLVVVVWLAVRGARLRKASRPQSDQQRQVRLCRTGGDG